MSTANAFSTIVINLPSLNNQTFHDFFNWMNKKPFKVLFSHCELFQHIPVGQTKIFNLISGK